MSSFEVLVKVILCHLFGYYVLQSDFIEKTKDSNLYHLFVHCALYCIPFLVVFGFNQCGFIALFLTHLIIDVFKIKGNIEYIPSQVLCCYTMWTCHVLFY